MLFTLFAVIFIGWLVFFVGSCLVADLSTAEDKLKQGSIMVDVTRGVAKKRGWVLHQDSYEKGTEIYVNPVSVLDLHINKYFNPNTIDASLEELREFKKENPSRYKQFTLEV